MKKVLLVISAFLLAAGSCSLWEDRTQEEPVARVFNQYLYPSDLGEAANEGTSPEDSAILARRYVDTWIKEQLMAQRAEQSLTEDQKDFSKQIAEYHRSLLIFTYRQKLLQQKLDTLVPGPEMEAYYQENHTNFLLSQDVIRGSFLKLPLDAPSLAEVRRWSRANTPEALNELEQYSISYAESFSDFNDRWVYFNTFNEQIPLQVSQPSTYLRYNRNLETVDSRFRYLLHVEDHLAAGQVAPLEMVREDIANIILNKKKIEFFRNLEKQVYNDGVNRNQFEIYDN